jgi:GT2 family glycosyltransferase
MTAYDAPVGEATPPDGTAAGVSVVLTCHHGRLPWLRRMLASLRPACQRAPEPTEVIVVDDSPEPEAALVRDACAELPATYLRGPARVGAKRNVGSRGARFDILLFSDSDCVADPDLLVEHLATLRGAGADVGAVVGLTTMVGDETFPWRVAARSTFYNQCFDFALRYRRVLWGTTSNMACRRAAFDRVGGFDADTLTRAGGEDVDLGVRLSEAGYTIVTNPGARVLHARDHVTRLGQIRRSLFSYGRADIYLLLRHPGRGVLRPLPARRLVLVAAAAAAVSLVALAPGALRVAGLVLGLLVLFLWGCGLAGRVAGLWRGPVGQRRERLLLGVMASATDASYRLGRLWEALRQRRPDLVLRRFGYTGTREFLRR